MSTQGLRKVSNYEDTLAAAIKDEQHVEGIISPYMQNFATQTINNPEFQRVKDRLEEIWVNKQKAILKNKFLNKTFEI